VTKESAQEVQRPPRRARWRRVAVPVVVGLASILLLVSVLATWVDRVALDNETYTDTSAQLLEQPEVHHALAVYLVDELYANVDVAQQLESALPPQAQPLAPTAAAFLRDYAVRAAERLLQSAGVQELWVKANQRAQERLVQVIEGGGPRVSTEGGDVTLNTGALVQRLADRLGLTTSPALADDQIVILRSNQLSTLQTVIDWLQAIALWLVFVVLALYALAIWLARGRRREAVRACGIGIVVVGVVLVLVRTVGGDQLIDTLAKLPQNRDAASASWDVLTQQLADATTTVIGVGLLTIVWAWLAGRGRRPVTVRRSLAAGARSHPGRVWLAFAAVVLLLILWAPTDAARRVLPVVVLTALAALGLELLRRQSLEEFPPGTSGGITLPRLPGLRPRQESHAVEIERLEALHDRGALTDDEFTSAKRSLLS
jgi:hypothetical protein